jgi:hypothetical protein
VLILLYAPWVHVLLVGQRGIDYWRKIVLEKEKIMKYRLHKTFIFARGGEFGQVGELGE